MSVRSLDRVIFTAFCFLFALVVSIDSLSGAASAPISPGSQFQPMPIAIADLPARAISASRSRLIANNLQRSGYFVPLDKSRFPERAGLRRRAAFRGVEARRRAGSRHRSRHPRPFGPAESRIPPVGCRNRPAAHRPAICHRPEFLAPHRPYHFGRGLHQDHRLRRLLRHPHGVRRQVRPEGKPPQAPRHHGPGRRQCALPDARRQPRRDAALFAGDAGHHLHVAGRSGSSRASR